MEDCKNTLSVLEKLAEALRCKVCEKVSKNPHTVGGCGHFSCHECLLSLKISQCPECGQQFYPHDLVPDAVAKTVLNEWKVIASLIGASTEKKLKLLLYNKKETKSSLHVNKSGTKLPCKSKENVKNDKERVESNNSVKMSSSDLLSCMKKCSEKKINSEIREENLKSGPKILTENDFNRFQENIVNEIEDNDSEREKSLSASDNGYKSHSDGNGSPEKKNRKPPDILSPIKSSDTEGSFVGFDDINIDNSFTPDKIKSKKRKSMSDFEKINTSKESDEHVKKAEKIKMRSKSDSYDRKKLKSHHHNKDDKNHLKKKDSSQVINENESINSSCDLIPATPQEIDDQGKERRKSHSHDKNTDKTDTNKCSSASKKERFHSTDDKKKRRKSSTDEKDKSKSNPSSKEISKNSSSGSVQHKTNRKKKDLKRRNEKGETELQIACEKGSLDLVKSLLADGADPNTKDNAGWTPLHEAVERGNVMLVELLLDAGAFVNVPGFYNITPLLEAVLKDNIVIARTLLQRGADINLRSRYNFLPSGCAQSEDMKKLLNIYKTQVVNTKKVDDFIFPMQEPTIMFGVNLDGSQKNALEEFCKMFDLTCVTTFSKEISHVVVNDDHTLVSPPDFSVLRAIVNGMALVSFVWIESCLREKNLLKPDKWEIKGTDDYPNSNTPMRSRQCVAKLLPKLFDGLHVYLSNYWSKNDEFTKAIATDLLIDAGASLLSREPDPEAIPDDEVTVMFHADIKGPMGTCSHVILFMNGPNEPQLQYNMKHIKSLSTEWLLNCIQSFSILDKNEN